MTLPKFLLAWSDFNWFWLYVRLRPAPTERWTLLRTLALTAALGGLGALLGLGFGLLIFRQPVGWLPWLLGLFSVCVGGCWFGVTGLCWNQRAARLKADSATPIKLPPSRFRFGRWCLGFVYLALLGVITPFALLVTVENIRGELTWKREHARLVAAGERLTFREILGAEIPPEQNAGAASIFAPFFNYRKAPEPHEQYHAMGQLPLVWPASNELARIEFALQLPDDYLPESERGTEAQTPAVNLTNWSIAFRTLVNKPKTMDNVPPKEFRMPEPGNPALDVLAGLLPGEPVLSEIFAAAALPRAQFPIHFDDAFDALLAHLSKMKSVQRMLELRCAAHLAAGETDAAFADATNALNVVELLREEPLLISQLVRYGQANIAASTLWQGLARHQWSDDQLAEFQRRLSQMDYLPGIVLAFEGERAAGIASMERIVNEPRTAANFMGENENVLKRGILGICSRGILRQNQVALAEFHSRNLAALRHGLKAVPEQGWVATIDEQQEMVFVRDLARVYSPYRAIATMLAPALSKATMKTARAQTTVKLAIVACALERYRLVHGQYPERLEQLVPQFATNVPLDPMVNQPFRYQRTDDGWFLLYSVGPNGRDDGGVIRSDSKNDKEDKDWPWPVPTRPAKARLF